MPFLHQPKHMHLMFPFRELTMVIHWKIEIDTLNAKKS